MSWTSGVHFLAGTMMGCFSLPPHSDQLLGPTQPPIQWVLGPLTLGVEQLDM